MKEIITVRNLKKNYQDVMAVKGINLTVYQGQLFAFLGPNGAGKSTTIDILTTFLKKDEGEINIAGFNIDENKAQIRDKIGVVFQDGSLDALLTVKENLLLRAGMYGYTKEQLLEQMKKVIILTSINNLLNRRYGKLSGGEKRRVDVARALMGRPKILFLDEPTTGLDPQTRKYLWKTILSLQKEEKMTIFLTTHYMEEASQADYIMVIDHGVIVAEGTPLMLKEKYTSDRLRLYSSEKQKLTEKLTFLALPYNIEGETIVIELQHTLDAISLLQQLQGHISAFEVIGGTLEDAFLNITGVEMRK